MTNANALMIDETSLLGGRVKLLQPKVGLRVGLDGVMLAASVPAQAGSRVLDLGCGSGGAGLCVMGRVSGVQLVGFDIQEDMLDCARQSAALNGWADVCRFVQGDVRDKGALGPDSFDFALCNPPYLNAGAWHDTPDASRSKALGFHAGEATLKDWVDCLQRVVKPRGAVSLVHRADHMDKVVQALGTRFGGVEIWPLHSYAGEAANRVVIRALKGRKSPCVLHQGIVLHKADGAWTPEAQAILADGGSL